AASLGDLETLAAAGKPFAVRGEAVVGLVALDTRRAAKAAGGGVRHAPPPGGDPRPPVTAFARQKDGPKALADVLKGRPPARDAARVGVRVLAGLGVPAPELADTLQAAAGQAGQRRKLDAGELKRLLSLVQTQGDAARGEEVFRR